VCIYIYIERERDIYIHRVTSKPQSSALTRAWPVVTVLAMRRQQARRQTDVGPIQASGPSNPKQKSKRKRHNESTKEEAG